MIAYIATGYLCAGLLLSLACVVDYARRIHRTASQLRAMRYRLIVIGVSAYAFGVWTYPLTSFAICCACIVGSVFAGARAEWKAERESVEFPAARRVR